MQKKYFEIKETTNPSKHSVLRGKIGIARTQVLWVFILTLLNIPLLIFGAGFYMIYSAIIPYIVVDMGMLFCGNYGPEFYEYYGEEIAFLPEGAFAVFVIIALILVGLFLLSFILSKKHKGWLVFALVYMCIDLAADIWFYGLNIQTIIDVVFHIIFIVILIRGITAYSKLEELPPEEQNTEFADIEQQTVNSNADLPNSTPLRIADFSVKHRTLLEYTANGHKILYRRVKKTNELVINDYVYGEYIALAELSHALTANLDGHTYTVGFDSTRSRSFLNIDNITVLEKMRWI